MRRISLQALCSLCLFGLATASGCGGAGMDKATRDAEPAFCFTDPALLAERAAQVGSGLPGALESAGLLLSETQFREWIASAGGAEHVEWLWDAHRQDLEYGLENLRECGAGRFVVGAPRTRDGDAKGYKVPVETVCADGTDYYFRVKVLLFKGCLYVGAIN